jgi:hypothetical protein
MVPIIRFLFFRSLLIGQIPLIDLSTSSTLLILVLESWAETSPLSVGHDWLEETTWLLR